MLDQTISHLDGPDFLDAVADAEEANGNLINAAEYRRRARQWANERAQHEYQGATEPAPISALRVARALPSHHITPTDHRR